MLHSVPSEYNIEEPIKHKTFLIDGKIGNWNGEYYAPGVIFDEAKVSFWSANTNYEIGDTVEYDAKF